LVGNWVGLRAGLGVLKRALPGFEPRTVLSI